MASVRPAPLEGRVKWEGSGDRLRVVIPAPRHLREMIFLAFFPVFWLFGELVGVTRLLRFEITPTYLFYVVWFSFWTFGGGFFCVALIWKLLGDEVIEVDAAALRHERRVLRVRIGPRRVFELRHLSGVRVGDGFVPSRVKSTLSGAAQAWGLTGGLLAFEYFGRTLEYGAGLSEVEATRMIREVETRRSSRQEFWK